MSIVIVTDNLTILVQAHKLALAYLLLLLGFMMFNNRHGDWVNKFLLPHSHAIIDADEDYVPVVSWVLLSWQLPIEASMRTTMLT
jgi:hypothetical protein